MAVLQVYSQAVGMGCRLEVAVLDSLQTKPWTPWKCRVTLLGCDTTCKRDEVKVHGGAKELEGGIVSMPSRRAWLGQPEAHLLGLYRHTASTRVIKRLGCWLAARVL